ncbi:MAG: OmpA family protein [Prevotella sp.]|uniref:PorE family type IX secretion system protein n=1 Tax=Prevotella sp. PTAC TaxID=2736295 RepID=UPI0015529D4F|nr:OmpA family protein [Prevotella sp. PTAC]MCX4292568.1 OmpA family protein [Prevotella sp.]NPD53597.1 OmpA family protein [Prevotella sp. PTAC]
MRRIYIILHTVIVVTLFASCGADNAMKKGDKFYALGEYFDASTQYKKAYSATPAKERATRGKRALKLAECYRRINYTQKAIAAYNNAIRYKQADSLTHLRLAQQLMKTGNYKEAAKNFEIALDSMPGSKLAVTGLSAARLAPQWKEAGSQYTVKRENFFNSRRADYSPMLAGDDNDQLFFTSTRNQVKGDELSGITGTKNGDIFFSQKDEKGKWTKPEDIDTELNSSFDEGACSFTPDGKTMYLTQCLTDPSYPRYATICTSERSDAAWGKATPLTITKDTLSSYAHPAVSPDGEWLYFTSDMPGGMGGLDIWRVRLTTSGLGGVENLGAPVNTEGDEMFPTFRPNGDLYFSSDGHPGMGGLDILIAKPDTAAGGWVIEHPGYPLNSQGDDFGMTFEGLRNRGFFSSNRGDGKGWDHIYSFENPEIVQTVKGWVYEQEGYELPEGLVYMVGNDGTNMKLSVKGDGSFTQEIKPGVDYVFLGTCKGFLNHKEQLRVEPVTESTEYVLQFPLASITAPVLIDNIFYDFDKATLRPESTTALDELIKLLNENPNVTIELSAHCDYRGAVAYNKVLSQKRAEAVVTYLIEHGIAKDRLSPVGYGKEKPKTIKKKLTEKYPFLKENDVLTEEFIKTLKPEEQEICNQLNRRTEFIVLRTTYGMFDEKGMLKERPKAEPAEPEPSDDFDGLF